jgi:hypothetical protein
MRHALTIETMLNFIFAKMVSAAGAKEFFPGLLERRARERGG